MKYRLAWPLLLLLFFGTTISNATDKRWTEVRSPHFRVLTDGSDKEARHAAREFEQMRSVFESGFPGMRLETGAPLTIFAAHDLDSIKVLAPSLFKMKGAHPVGFFQHGWEKSYAVYRMDIVNSDRVNPDTYAVVYHEYVHSLLHANFRWLPTWLDEGLAEFYGYTRFERNKMYVGAPPKNDRGITGLSRRPTIPIDMMLEVTPASPFYHDENKVYAFYTESWLLVHYLFFGPGMQQGEKLKQFFNQLQQGTEQKKAFAQVFGDTKAMDPLLDQYLSNFAFTNGELPSPPGIDEDTFATRQLTEAETEAELGQYYLRSQDKEDAKPMMEKAAKDDPKLGLAHENLGFLDFGDGKDEDAAREFTQAYDLDPKLYLSLYFKTMMSPAARSDAAADLETLHTALLKVVEINPEFAPAYVELSKLAVRQNNLQKAYGLSRKAEALEPNRAGYHSLSGKVLQRMGKNAEAADFARYVIARWSYGPDHDEALELWQSLPAGQRGANDLVEGPRPADTTVATGPIKSASCEAENKASLVLDVNGKLQTFRRTEPRGFGFSDSLWYGADHFSLCHHLEGLRGIVVYKKPSDNTYAGDLWGLEFREDLPAAMVVKAEAAPHP